MSLPTNKQKVREEIIKRIIEKGENKNMVQEKKPKKQTVKRARSGLDRLNITKENYQSIAGGSKGDTQQGVSNESIEAKIKETIISEIPKLIKNGSIDIKSLIGGNGGVNQPIASDNQLFSIMDVLNKSLQANNGNQQQNQPNMNADIIKALYTELQKVMNQQQQKGNDNMLLAYLLKQKESGNSDVLTTMLGHLFQQNANFQNALMNLQFNSNQPQQDPQDKLMKNFNFFRKVTGDNRAKNEKEMDYSLRKDEMVLKEQSRQDLMNREERAIIRDDKKSEMILNMGSNVLNKIVGDNLSTFVGDMFNVSSKKGKGKRRGRRTETESEPFDPSLLDEL